MANFNNSLRTIYVLHASSKNEMLKCDEEVYFMVYKRMYCVAIDLIHEFVSLSVENVVGKLSSSLYALHTCMVCDGSDFVDAISN